MEEALELQDSLRIRLDTMVGAAMSYTHISMRVMALRWDVEMWSRSEGSAEIVQRRNKVSSGETRYSGGTTADHECCSRYLLCSTEEIGNSKVTCLSITRSSEVSLWSC